MNNRGNIWNKIQVIENVINNEYIIIILLIE